MTLQERQRKFIAWRDDLEQRLALHIFLHENRHPKAVVSAPVFIAIEKPMFTPKLKVEVVESPSLVGAWEVYINGRMTNYYSGPDAHLKATKRAGEIANEV